ncbi:DUF3576 domain-containing protein [Celeribacter marinus]|uniref:DUF3576 domain-containing protein n=1 Tax=Celeribacter marinus TaxID=1397108 RepID=UPI00317F8F03
MYRSSLALIATLALSACSGGGSLGSLGDSIGFGSIGSGPFGRDKTTVVAEGDAVVDTRSTGQAVEIPNGEVIIVEQRKSRTIFGGGRNNASSDVQVNKYIWNAALEVLSFLPVQSADPFTGVITTGYGTPPNGGRAYRATIHVTDPALDARTLNISLYTRGGAASADTVRAVENAILTRARQLRSSR